MAFWNRETTEEKIHKQQLQFQKEQNREDNAARMVDPSDQTYLYQKEQLPDLTRWQQDLDNDIELLRHDFRNEILTNEGWGMIEGTSPLINEIGISKLISLIKRYLTRNVIMSNLDDIIITRIMRGLVIDITIHLAFNYKRYDVDFSDLTLIVRMIKDSIEPTLYRSYNNGERNYLNTINKRIETTNLSPSEKQNKGLFNIG